MRKLKRRHEPYWLWEDFIHGMYQIPSAPISEAAAVAILSNPQKFLLIAEEMIVAWPIAAAVNLTNDGINRRAWVGQASCCFAAGIPELTTRTAWKILTNEQRRDANRIADRVIAKYEIQNQEVHQALDGPWLF